MTKVNRKFVTALGSSAAVLSSLGSVMQIENNPLNLGLFVNIYADIRGH